MNEKRYVSIDSSFIADGMVLNFDIYSPPYGDDDAVLIKAKNSIIDSKDLMLISDNNDKVYINAIEHNSYKEHLNGLRAEKAKKDNTAEESNFQEKSKVVYSKATMALDKLFKNPETLGNYEVSKEVVNDLVENILDDNFTIKSLMSIAAHDYYTHTHSLNVAIYSLALGAYLKLDREALSELGEAALLHDLGKSKIDLDIINKNGALSEAEFKKMKAHPSLGHALGIKIGIKNKKVLDAIRHHHEKMDGSGYPYGLSMDDIPLYAKIVGLCDIFDALTSKRSYKEPMTTFDALKLIKVQMKDHVDIKLLQKIIMMFR